MAELFAHFGVLECEFDRRFQEALFAAAVITLASVVVGVYAFGLDATHQVRATPARTTRIHALGSRSAVAAARLLEFSNALPANGPREHGAPLHDPCPIAWLLAPQLFRFRPCHIDVEVDSPLTLGHTAVEFRASSERAQNVQWAIEADADGVFDLLERYFAAGRSGKA